MAFTGSYQEGLSDWSIQRNLWVCFPQVVATRLDALTHDDLRTQNIFKLLDCTSFIFEELTPAIDFDWGWFYIDRQYVE